MPLFMGKLHNDNSLSTVLSMVETDTSFTGCIRDVYLGDQLLDLQLASTYTSQDPVQASPGCPRDELCYTKPCQNEAACVSLWDGFTCVCSPDYTGDDCSEVKATTYNGNNSTMQLRIDTQLVGFGDEFSLDFRTRDYSGLVMRIDIVSDSLTGTISYMLLKVVDFMPQFEVFFGQEIQVIDIPVTVTDGNWYHIEWTRQRSEISVDFLDLNFTVVGSYDMYQPQRNDIIDVYIGGYPGVCRNGGTCTNLPGSYSCDCASGFRGTSCNEDINECNELEDACIHGTCTNTFGSYTCMCNVGYTGATCDLNIDECSSQSCEHNGTCIDEVGGHRCDCTGTGYEGDICNVDIDECETNQHECQNGGECVNKVGTYNCICSAEYTGVYCEIAAETGVSSTIIIVIIILIIILAIILILCCLWKVRDSRKQKGKYKPSMAEMQVGTPLSNMIDADADERLV
uniref:Protein crumbs homolog 1-like n=1 Tax=Saccoglossus kowalevskii TaxID=10224 RepID=A0ABM0M4U0_SACKO|nr:PREDICTED: protein crumbs homolog 1-like [Saccoglossus kowalevskii]